MKCLSTDDLLNRQRLFVEDQESEEAISEKRRPKKTGNSIKDLKFIAKIPKYK